MDPQFVVHGTSACIYDNFTSPVVVGSGVIKPSSFRVVPERRWPEELRFFGPPVGLVRAVFRIETEVLTFVFVLRNALINPNVGDMRWQHAHPDLDTRTNMPSI